MPEENSPCVTQRIYLQDSEKKVWKSSASVNIVLI